MTSTILQTVALVYATALAQSDDMSAMELLVAATSAERVITHGEIVFHYESSSKDELGWMIAPDGDLELDALELIFNFRDREHFRLTIQDGGRSRSIVSDGEYIDTGSGELWDFRFFSEPWVSAIDADDDRFYDQFWPYYAVVERHLFPLSTSYESDNFNDDDGTAEFESVNDAAPNARTIRFSMFEDGFDDDDLGVWERFVVITDPGFRLAAWTGHIDDESYEHEEWSEPLVMEDGALVMGTYRYTYPDDEELDSTSTIDFGASNFGHMPHESEFVIDPEAFDRVVKWREPNPLAEEIEYYLYMWFGAEVDIEPLIARTVKTSLIIVAVLAAALIAIEVRRHRRKRKKQD